MTQETATHSEPILFRHTDFELEFAPDNGALTALRFRGETILSGGCDFALCVADRRFITPRLARHEQADIESGARLTLQYEVDESESAARGSYLKAVQTFDVVSEPGRAARIERRLRVERQSSGAPDKLLAATLFMRGLQAGDAGSDSTHVSVPMARGLPAFSMREALRRPRVFENDPLCDELGEAYDSKQSAPDIFIGAATVERVEPPLHITITPRPNQCPARLRVYGEEGSLEGSSLVVEHEFRCESWLRAGEPLDVAAQTLHVAQRPWRAALPSVGHYLSEAGYAPPQERPAWARDATILEIDLEFHGGLRNLTSKLDTIRDIGFNTLYLMPWHEGGYATRRYDAINPDYGTFRDLRALCDAAHARGMKVLFDLLVNIAGEGSPYPTEHPDWFYRDETGTVLRHPTWGGSCFDAASPGLRRFLADYAVRCCTEWGADGFRVDAVAYRGGNWNNLPGLQPHQHSHAAFTLAGEIRDAVRKANPDAICLAECFGPEQASISDLVALQWISWLDWALNDLLSGKLNGATMARILGEHFAAMPCDVWFVGYTHTHDTVAFEKRDLQGPAVDALFATLSLLCAGTMVFGGGWKMRERPNQQEAEEYRALFGVRAQLGGVAGHEIAFSPCDDCALLVAARPSARGAVRAVTNFSGQARPLPFVSPAPPLYSRLGSGAGEIAPYDTLVFAAPDLR